MKRRKLIFGLPALGIFTLLGSKTSAATYDETLVSTGIRPEPKACQLNAKGDILLTTGMAVLRHVHHIVLTRELLDNPVDVELETSTPEGFAPFRLRDHTHKISLSADEIQRIANGEVIKKHVGADGFNPGHAVEFKVANTKCEI